MKRLLVVCLAACLTACGAGGRVGTAPIASARAEATDRVGAATRVVQHLATEWDGALPRALSGAARCVAIVPGLVHAGLLVGLRGGEGVVSCREGSGWSRPDFFRLSGASAGLSAGVQRAELVMLVMTNEGEAALLAGNMQIGAGTSVVAGPVGRTAMVATEVALGSSIV
ncbi:MAG TPA: lipid-binding SYLF domain-containing protein, partial [Polyangiaceae bacterium]